MCEILLGATNLDIPCGWLLIISFAALAFVVIVAVWLGTLILNPNLNSSDQSTQSDDYEDTTTALEEDPDDEDEVTTVYIYFVDGTEIRITAEYLDDWSFENSSITCTWQNSGMVKVFRDQNTEPVETYNSDEETITLGYSNVKGFRVEGD